METRRRIAGLLIVFAASVGLLLETVPATEQASPALERHPVYQPRDAPQIIHIPVSDPEGQVPAELLLKLEANGESDAVS